MTTILSTLAFLALAMLGVEWCYARFVRSCRDAMSRLAATIEANGPDPITDQEH